MKKLGEVGKLSPELEREYPLWRLWEKHGTPIAELRKWTWPDVMKANAILDMRDSMDVAYQEMSTPKDVT